MSRATGAPTFVAPAERIAVFDNDGTLWVEQPMYTQMVFILDWVKANAAQHPEWRDNPVFKALAANDHSGARGDRASASCGLSVLRHKAASATEAYHAACASGSDRARTRSSTGRTPSWCTSRSSSC